MKSKIFTLIAILIFLLSIFYIGKKFIGTHIFISPSQIMGLINPSTFKVKTNSGHIYITSYLIRTARGDEGCQKAVNMSKIGYKITNMLLKNANVIRLTFMNRTREGKKTAKIYIDEQRLGTLLYDSNAAIKYKKDKPICGDLNK